MNTIAAAPSTWKKNSSRTSMSVREVFEKNAASISEWQQQQVEHHNEHYEEEYFVGFSRYDHGMTMGGEDDGALKDENRWLKHNSKEQDLLEKVSRNSGSSSFSTDITFTDFYDDDDEDLSSLTYDEDDPTNSLSSRPSFMQLEIVMPDNDNSEGHRKKDKKRRSKKGKNERRKNTRTARQNKSSLPLSSSPIICTISTPNLEEKGEKNEKKSRKTKAKLCKSKGKISSTCCDKSLSAESLFDDVSIFKSPRRKSPNRTSKPNRRRRNYLRQHSLPMGLDSAQPAAKAMAASFIVPTRTRSSIDIESFFAEEDTSKNNGNKTRQGLMSRAPPLQSIGFKPMTSGTGMNHWNGDKSPLSDKSFSSSNQHSVLGETMAFNENEAPSEMRKMRRSKSYVLRRSRRSTSIQQQQQHVDGSYVLRRNRSCTYLQGRQKQEGGQRHFPQTDK